MTNDAFVTLGFLISVAFYVFLPFYLISKESEDSNKDDKNDP